MTELAIGKLVRINTEVCPAQSQCPGKHPMSHLQYHGEIGLIEDDARKYTGPNHRVGCQTCYHMITVAEYVKATDHYWMVCLNGHHPMFHVDELTEMAPIKDQVRDAMAHLGELVEAVSELPLIPEGVGV